MGLNVSPTIRVVANDQDVTAAIVSRLRGLRMTDATGTESDTLEITLADHDPLRPIKRPGTGAELELFLGYDGTTRRMGMFVVDEIESGGRPRYLTIRARAAVYDGTPKGKKNLQSQKARDWAKGTTVGAMVAKIAAEHGLKPAVAKSLASITLPHLEQTHESNLSFLLRAMKPYGAIVKPANGFLIVAKRGESKTVSGAQLPTVTLQESDMVTWSCRLSAKEGRGTVVAHYRDREQSKDVDVVVGSGDPVKRIRHPYTSAATARAAAQAELDRRERGQEVFSGSLPGRNDLVAEGRIVLQGFGGAEDGQWLLTRVEHLVDENGGYSCSIEAEKPTTAEK